MGNSLFHRWLAARAGAEAVARQSSSIRDLSGGASGEPRILDSAALDNLRLLQHEDDPDVLRQVVESFLDSSAELLATLRSGQSVVDLRLAAHTLKSSCAAVGAVELARLCRTLESLDDTAAISAARPTIDEIEKIYPVVCEALIRECEQDGFPITAP